VVQFDGHDWIFPLAGDGRRERVSGWTGTGRHAVPGMWSMHPL
jgi:hypothetical protein